MGFAARSLVVLAPLLGLASCTPSQDPVLATDTDTDANTDPSSTSGGDGASTGIDDPTTTPGTDGPPLDESGTSGVGSTGPEPDPVCGNGIVEAGEACDDEGESTRCNDDCTAAACGDGLVNATAGEACDDEGESTRCDADCTPVACGDGYVNPAAGEACEGAELAGASCQTEGFYAGALACTPECSLDVGGCSDTPGMPVLALGFSAIKQFDFSWAAADGATFYQLEESQAPGEPFVQLGGDIVGTSISLTMPLHFRYQASYRLRACNPVECTDSGVVSVTTSLAEAVGYVKSASPGSSDRFGHRVALSADGTTLAIGVPNDDSNAGIDGDPANDLASNSGSVYVLVRDSTGAWSQAAYIKASNAGPGDSFGHDLALSADGNTLAVGAYEEDTTAFDSGAAYVFVRDGMGQWSEQAMLKASNPGTDDFFGWSVALSADGDVLAVGAYYEDSSAVGIDGDQADEGAISSGAAYVFVRDGLGAWSQEAYVKASNTGQGDVFGYALALAGDGNTLAVGALLEESNATGVGGNQADDTAPSGAVYVLVRDGGGAWTHQAYVKASNTGQSDGFGGAVSLSFDGDTLAIGATGEDSGVSGIDGSGDSNFAFNAGAVYVLVRDGGDAWSQQAYVKPSDTDEGDLFGDSLALSADGNILVVGASSEGSNATGIDGDQANNLGDDSGAAYVLVRAGGGTWSHHAYVKASNTDPQDGFGTSVALSSDGGTLAVGAPEEDGSFPGIGGDQADDSLLDAGAVYLY